MGRKVPRWALVVSAIAVAAVAVDVGVFLALRGGDSSAALPPPGKADSVAVIDPARGRLVAQIHVGHEPTAIGAGYGGVWVLNKEDATVTHIDPRNRIVVGTISTDATANAIALGAGGVWFAGHPRDAAASRASTAFERIDPDDGKVVQSFRTPAGAAVLAAGGGALWSSGVLRTREHASTRADLKTGRMSRINLGLMDGDLVAADDQAAYYVASLGNRVARVDTRTGRMTNGIGLVSIASLNAGKVAADPTSVAIGGGSVWISETDGKLLRLDPLLHGITKIPVCTNALAVAFGEGAAWVACSDMTVVEVDPTTARATRRIPVGRLPRGIAAGEGGVWVTLN